MVLFDIKLSPPNYDDVSNPYAHFTPDISKLVIFNPKRKEKMQQRTQTQILREYEPIRLSMLANVGVKTDEKAGTPAVK